MLTLHNLVFFLNKLLTYIPIININYMLMYFLRIIFEKYKTVTIIIKKHNHTVKNQACILNKKFQQLFIYECITCRVNFDFFFILFFNKIIQIVIEWLKIYMENDFEIKCRSEPTSHFQHVKQSIKINTIIA